MENRDWLSALQKFQPSTGQGAQSAGNPGMGGGSVPYAPGATQFQPQSQGGPPQGMPPSGGQPMPQGAGAPPPQMGQGGPPQGQQGQSMGDPQRAVMIAEYLMARLRHQMSQGQRARRG